jgi:Ca-activated chloride channel family protein
MTFADPNWAWWLFALPVIALFKIAADARARQVTTIFVTSERLRTALQGGTSMIRSGVRFGLQLLGLGFFILALTRPQVGDQQREIEQTGRNILIAIDCSKSMLANDVKPDRLTRAKLAAQDLLEKLPNDRVGIIAFAGRAFLQAPLTTDHEAVIETIQALNYTTIPRGGSSLGSAIALGLHSVEKMPGRQHGLIIFTDGQETDNAMLETAREAREKNLLILPVGVGTADGELIPDPDPMRAGDFVRDEDGNPVKSQLEAAALEELARVSGSEYVELNSQALTQTLVDRLLSNLDRHQAESRHLSRPIDRYQWPLFAGILCLLMSLVIHPSARRQVRPAPLPVDPQSTVHQPRLQPQAALIALLVLTLPLQGTAATTQELKAARNAYDEGQFEQAKKFYQRFSEDLKEQQAKESNKRSRLGRLWHSARQWLNPNDEGRAEIDYGLGASTMRLKDYDTAARAFSDALQSPDPDIKRRAQRGLATSLYEQGESIMVKQPDRTIKNWTDSRDHFDSAMRTAEEGSKEYAELKENRDFVQRRLDELKQEQARKQQQQQQQKDDQQGKGKGKGKEKDKKSSGNSDQPPEDSGEKFDAIQKEQAALPEGQIRAGEAGQQPEDKPQDKPSGGERNEKTGFTVQEALDQLRTYADDQKYDGRSLQYLMRDERPAGGKDY